ncbi:myb-related transcription factor, partner of profilin-like [Protopterus annectens]|uniref:myb-related transcription factor, partner of profilin-like n=1 Tax=Protopterus annectens TaxID=7888 RepID=UPI001CFAE169|nr:myb-related transcription factor, partner of profilin-like [Protopterus annectens]
MSAEITDEVTRLRKPRFSFEENQILIQEVRANYAKLFGVRSKRLSTAERRGVWENIATKINAITSWKRTGQEVQKRWNDLKRRTKERLSRVPHSTQGPNTVATCEETLSAEEELIFGIVGPATSGGEGVDCASPAGTQQQEHPISDPAAGSSSSASFSDNVRDDILLQPKLSDSPPPSCTEQVSQISPFLKMSPQSGGSIPQQSPFSPQHPLVDSMAEYSVGHCNSPPLRRRRLQLEQPLVPDTALDFLQTQRETAEAIRDLAATIREGFDKLTGVVASILPLLQERSVFGAAGIKSNLSESSASGLMMPFSVPPTGATALSTETLTTKVEDPPSSPGEPSLEAGTSAGGDDSEAEQVTQETCSSRPVEGQKDNHPISRKRRGRRRAI